MEIRAHQSLSIPSLASNQERYSIDGVFRICMQVIVGGRDLPV
jgi:hypothetical protein